MKQKKLVLLEPDWEYGKRLAEYFNVSDWMPFKTEVFSDPDAMESYIKDMPPDLLMVNEQMLKEEYRTIPLLVLCETLIIAEMDTPQIYKYQSGQEIGRELISWYAMQTEHQAVYARQEKLRVVGIYSFDKKREKNLLAWEVAKYLGKQGKTLYLNLEPYSGMEEYFGKFTGESLSDYLFFLRQNRGNTGFYLQGMTEQRAGVDFVPPAKAWEDVRDIRMEEWRRMIQAVEMETAYTALVIDISEAAGDFMFWFSVCERVFIPVGEDFYSQTRKKEMRAFLEKRMDQETLDKWIECSLGNWQKIHEYAEEVYPEMDRMLHELLRN